MRNFIFHPIADTEIQQAAYYYERQRKNLGEEFIEEIYQYIEKIIDNPFLYPLALNNVRCCIVKRFPYKILFQIMKNEEVQILGIMHQQRQLNNWNRH